MPIFTFMGANIMRLDDAYSFQVINKTVQTVIPALIQVSVPSPPAAHHTIINQISINSLLKLWFSTS